jgi:hypothetical protein
MGNILSTKEQIKEFTESLIWKDFVNEMELLSDALSKEYDSVGEPRPEKGEIIYPNQAEVLIHLGDIKGRRKAIKYFLSLPNILINFIEGNKDDS